MKKKICETIRNMCGYEKMRVRKRKRERDSQKCNILHSVPAKWFNNS